MRLRIRIVCAAMALTALVALAVPLTVYAGIGVGTDTGKIVVTDAMPAGGSYTLPSFKLINAGTVPTGYILKSVAMTGTMVPDASWFTFEPKAVYLGAQQSAVITVTVNVPADAKPGMYKCLLVGEPSEVTTRPSGAHVNIGAGPRLEMQVTASDPLQTALSLPKKWFFGGMPWTAGGSAALVLAIVGTTTVARRRGKRSLALVSAEEDSGEDRPLTP